MRQLDSWTPGTQPGQRIFGRHQPHTHTHTLIHKHLSLSLPLTRCTALPVGYRNIKPFWFIPPGDIVLSLWMMWDSMCLCWKKSQDTCHNPLTLTSAMVWVCVYVADISQVFVGQAGCRGPEFKNFNRHHTFTTLTDTITLTETITVKDTITLTDTINMMTLYDDATHCVPVHTSFSNCDNISGSQQCRTVFTENFVF